MKKKNWTMMLFSISDIYVSYCFYRNCATTIHFDYNLLAPLSWQGILIQTQKHTKGWTMVNSVYTYRAQHALNTPTTSRISTKRWKYLSVCQPLFQTKIQISFCLWFLFIDLFILKKRLTISLEIERERDFIDFPNEKAQWKKFVVCHLW